MKKNKKKLFSIKSAPEAKGVPSADGTQAAALCYRKGKSGPEILMITSRDTGRWIIPKGWPHKRKTLAQAAALEAFEEAGAKGRVASKPIGSYVYDKKLDDGESITCKTSVFPMKVKALAKHFPERGQRDLKWMSAAKAAAAVDEPDLKKLIEGFSP